MSVGRTERAKYLKSLEGLNEFDRLLKNLESGEFSILHLELAYRQHVRDRKDLPDGVKNILVAKEHGGIIHFAEEVRQIVGAVHLAYLRGKETS